MSDENLRENEYATFSSFLILYHQKFFINYTVFESKTFFLFHSGVRSLILLGMSGGGESNYPAGEEETHMTFDLLNDNFEILAQKTYYNCRLHKLPDFTEKQHMVKVNLKT